MVSGHFNENSSAVLSNGIIYSVCSSNCLSLWTNTVVWLHVLRKPLQHHLPAFQNFAYTRENFLDSFLHKKLFLGKLTNRIVTVFGVKEERFTAINPVKSPAPPSSRRHFLIWPKWVCERGMVLRVPGMQFLFLASWTGCLPRPEHQKSLKGCEGCWWAVHICGTNIFFSKEFNPRYLFEKLVISVSEM